MAIRKDYKTVEDFIRAVQATTTKEVFIFEVTAREKGENVSRTIANEAGVITDAVLVPSEKVTSAFLLSCEETRVLGAIKENYFLYYDETISIDFCADESELAEAQSKQEARIGEIYHLFSEKSPDITIVKGRVAPA